MTARLLRMAGATGVWFAAFTISGYSSDGWTIWGMGLWWLTMVGVAAFVVRDVVLPVASRADLLAQLLACYIGGVLSRALLLGGVGQTPSVGATTTWVLMGAWLVAELQAMIGLVGVVLSLLIVLLLGVVELSKASTATS